MVWRLAKPVLADVKTEFGGCQNRVQRLPKPPSKPCLVAAITGATTANAGVWLPLDQNRFVPKLSSAATNTEFGTAT